jgi:hypothetical protein
MIAIEKRSNNPDPKAVLNDFSEWVLGNKNIKQDAKTSYLQHVYNAEKNLNRPTPAPRKKVAPSPQGQTSEPSRVLRLGPPPSRTGVYSREYEA